MIELIRVTKRYGNIIANDEVCLKVNKGELMTLLGPSGCGKTTTLRCITGHCSLDQGEIFIEGKNVTILPPNRRKVGMVFQNFALFPHMTVFENIYFPLRIRGIGKKKAGERIYETLNLVQLSGYENHYPRQLSGGQQQRVGLARALVYQPKILLLDEPLSNLDAKFREEMRFEIKELQKRLGITAIYVTHDQEEALALSDKIAIMKDGRIHQVGTPEEIFERPKTFFVATFIGLSNIIQGTVKNTHPLCLDIGSNLILTISYRKEIKIGEKVQVLIRPNDVEFMTDEKGGKDNIFDGTVARTTYLGSKMDYLIDLTSRLEIRIQTDLTFRHNIGDRVKVYLPISKCKILS
ncbi:ABC transporter ATP-binding protein [candidate division WOR-3 bacterium]|nr:ABC transporter ATP-binding protein [candidate division WOR-3 bacterium]